MKKKLRYNVKQNFFKGTTFAFIERSFLENGLEEEVVENMKRFAIENGGKVIENEQNANYLVHDDGFNKTVWN